MLVGNKTDMAERRQVSVEEAEKKSEEEKNKKWFNSGFKKEKGTVLPNGASQDMHSFKS